MPLEKPQALDASEPYDVCIVGSGPAGTVLGTRLVEHGLRTLILESGPESDDAPHPCVYS